MGKNEQRWETFCTACMMDFWGEDLEVRALLVLAPAVT